MKYLCLILLMTCSLCYYKQNIHAQERDSVRYFDDPVARAITRNQIDLVKKFIRKDSSILHDKFYCYSDNVHPLYFAIWNECDTQIIQFFIESGLKVSVNNGSLGTPFDLIDEMRKSFPFASTTTVVRPIEYYDEVYKILEPYDKAEKEEYMKSPIWKYIEKGDVKNAEKLIKAGYSIEIQNMKREYPINIAIQNGDIPMLRMLYFYNKNINFQKNEYFENIEKISYYIEECFNIQERTRFIVELEKDPHLIDELFQNQHAKFFQYVKEGIAMFCLLPCFDVGIDPLVKDEKGRYIWQIYGEEMPELKRSKKIFNSFIKNYRKNPKHSINDIVQIPLFLLNGRKLPQLSKNAYDKNKKNPIWKYIEQNNIDSINYWAKKSYDVNIQYSDGETPLMKALKNLNYEMVYALIKRNANPLLKTYKGDNPFIAIYLIYDFKRNSEYINRLMWKHIYADKSDTELNKTLIEHVKMGDDIHSIKILLDLGANPNIKDTQGKTLEELYAISSTLLNRKRNKVKSLIEDYIKKKKTSNGSVKNLSTLTKSHSIPKLELHQYQEKVLKHKLIECFLLEVKTGAELYVLKTFLQLGVDPNIKDKNGNNLESLYLKTNYKNLKKGIILNFC